jgi:hypothetical protein
MGMTGTAIGKDTKTQMTGTETAIEIETGTEIETGIETLASVAKEDGKDRQASKLAIGWERRTIANLAV